jgi:PIN domain nuclease of toxin-antitoxin system
VNLLLDSHVLLWWLEDAPRLGLEARDAVADPSSTVYVSAASAWEIAIKAALGRLRGRGQVARWLPGAIAHYRFVELPVTVRHAVEVESLPRYHADPFDRLLVAQARVEGLTLVTADAAIRRYDVRVLRALDAG